jgi:hypothetical protein
MKTKLSQIVDRNSFMAWIDGDLLVRNEKGNVVVGDNIANEKAEKLLSEGKMIGFTVGGELVSTMKLEGEGSDATYVERNCR